MQPFMDRLPETRGSEMGRVTLSARGTQGTRGKRPRSATPMWPRLGASSRFRTPLSHAWACGVAVLLGINLLCPGAKAAFAEIPGLKEGEEEKIAARLAEEGRQSLAEMLRVGQERYEQRLSMKRALAAGLTVQYREIVRQTDPPLRSPPTSTTSPGRAGDRFTGMPLGTVGLALLLAGCFVLLHVYRRNRPPGVS